MKVHEKKGVIALDLDGTLTTETEGLSAELIQYLSEIASDGWTFVFLTGRNFERGKRTLEALPFPYILGVQNGALMIEMPGFRVVARKILSMEILPRLNQICEEESTDYIIYSGFEHGDWCYYRPSHLPKLILSYVTERTRSLKEKWRAVDSFEGLPFSDFTSLKFFAKEKEALSIGAKLEKIMGLHAPLNKDPFDHSYTIIQATHPEATKGDALQDYLKTINHSGPIIAAGDDQNDLTMLQKAEVKIVMANAPAELLTIADIVAPSASENGIFRGLAEALSIFSKGRSKDD